MKKAVVSFIVPALNEERNIRDTFDTIRVNVPFDALDYEIVFVDGGSEDRTVQIARFLAQSDPRIKIYAEGGVGGFGDAFKKGVSLAHGDYLMLVPGDNEVSGEAIRAILSEAGSADMIIPYFTNQEIRPLVRRLLSRLFVLILNSITGYRLRYYNGTVLYRAHQLKGYGIRTSGFAFQAECVIHLLSNGSTFKEVGTKIQHRGSGRTKAFSARNAASVSAFILRLIARYRFGWGRAVQSGDGMAERRGRTRCIPVETALPPLDIPPEINYIAAFLTFSCNLTCPYCINNYEAQIMERRTSEGKAWAAALNRLRLPHNLPVTLQGGEPTLHPDFYSIIESLRPDIEIDILTNLQFDIDEFIRRVNPKRINRDTRYHSIRASFHPLDMDLEETIQRAARLQNAGFSICLSAVDHPDFAGLLPAAEKKSAEAGIAFFRKEFLGFFAGKCYGTYKYPEAVAYRTKRKVLCRSTEILISPSLGVHRCTRDVYTNGEAIGHMLDPAFRIEFKYRQCNNFGYCNPCDIKIKTDRFLRHGHTSVDVIFSGHEGQVLHP